MRGQTDHSPNTWVNRVYIVNQSFTKDVWDCNFFIDKHAAGSKVTVPPIRVNARVKAFSRLSLLMRIQSLEY